MNRILLIRGGAIGDFVLTLPAMKLLREAHPKARLEILGYPHIAALAEGRFYADAIRSIEAGGLARFFARDAELPQELADHFATFDLVVSYLFDPDRIFEDNVRRCGVRNFLACSPKISGEDTAARQLARPLQELGLTLAEDTPRLFPSAADRTSAQEHFPEERLIAIHPGSGSAAKNWPLENWIALIERLIKARPENEILVVGGEADEDQLAKLRDRFARQVRFAKNLPLTQLAAVLERCALFLGHDSGISHIAAAVGTPSLLLFGQTNAAIWGPTNSNARVLQSSSGQTTDISLARVEDAALALLRRGSA